MLLPEPEYISMQGATETFDISIEHLRRLVEEKRLSAYIIRKCDLTNDPLVYTKIIGPVWEKHKLYFHQMYAVIDYGENPQRYEVADGKVQPRLCNAMYDEKSGFEYFEVLIKPDELRALGLSECNIDISTINQFDANLYLAENNNDTIAEKVYQLRNHTKMTNQEIGDLLNVGTGNPRSKSRKVKVQNIFRQESIKRGTWNGK